MHMLRVHAIMQLLLQTVETQPVYYRGQVCNPRNNSSICTCAGVCTHPDQKC